MDKEQVDILIGGDFCPVGRAEKLLLQGERIISHDLEAKILESDIFIANLEAPLISKEYTSILKKGPHLKASNKVVNGFKQIHFSALSLSNNHIMDYGVDGLNDTIKALDEINLEFFGIQSRGVNKVHKIFTTNGLKIGFVGLSNFEFSTFYDFNDNGTYPIDPIYAHQIINELKESCDQIIFLLHTGLYDMPLPFEYQRKFCRYLVDLGVTAVFCQHSHTCGSYEEYKQGFISYGQGHLVFDLNNASEAWAEGYLVKLTLSKNRLEGFEIIGIKQFYDTENIRLMRDEEQNVLLLRLNGYNNILIDENKYRDYLNQFYNKLSSYYFGQLLFPEKRIFKYIRRRFNFGILFPSRLKISILNMLRTEEHKEVFTHIIKNNLGSKFP